MEETKAKTSQLNVRLPIELFEKISKEVEETKSNKSEVVANILEKYFKTKKPAKLGGYKDPRVVLSSL